MVVSVIGNFSRQIRVQYSTQQVCLLSESGSPAMCVFSYARVSRVMLTSPSSWPNDLDMRMWPSYSVLAHQKWSFYRPWLSKVRAWTGHRLLTHVHDRHTDSLHLASHIITYKYYNCKFVSFKLLFPQRGVSYMNSSSPGDLRFML